MEYIQPNRTKQYMNLNTSNHPSSNPTIIINLTSIDKKIYICGFKHKKNGHKARSFIVIVIVERAFYSTRIYLFDSRCDSLKCLLIATRDLIRILTNNKWWINIISKIKWFERLKI